MQMKRLGRLLGTAVTGKNSGNIVYFDGHAKYRHLIDTFKETNGINECV